MTYTYDQPKIDTYVQQQHEVYNKQSLYDQIQTKTYNQPKVEM